VAGFEIVLEILKAGTLLLIGAIGEIYAERAGVMNLGVEGMMAVGAAVAFSITSSTGNPWLGVLAACAVGAAMSLIHAVATISFHANQVVSGLALCMVGIGASMWVGKPLVGAPLEKTLPTMPFIYLGVASAFLAWFVLNWTKLGLAIKAVGEDPAAADAAGIDVALVRYGCVCFGGLMAGLAGGYLSVSYIPLWTEKVPTAGRGWIVIALVIFASWSPVRAILGAYLFGCTEILGFTLQRFGINPYILGMLPYTVTILVMVVGAHEALKKRLGAPAALGKPYIREEKLV